MSMVEKYRNAGDIVLAFASNLTINEKAAWERYCADTAGSMDVRDFWHELSPSMQAHYLEKTR